MIQRRLGITCDGDQEIRYKSIRFETFRYFLRGLFRERLLTDYVANDGP